MPSFPFIHNRYFKTLVNHLFVKQQLKFFHSILKHQTLEYEPTPLNHIKNGLSALDDSMYLVEQNIHYLNYLELEAIRKFPELSLDPEFLFYLNGLKIKLMKNQEKMVKKKNVLNKYQIKTKKMIRKLKKFN